MVLFAILSFSRMEMSLDRRKFDGTRRTGWMFAFIHVTWEEIAVHRYRWEMMDDVQWLSALVSIESLLSRLERDDGNDSLPCRLFLFVYVLEIFYPSAIRICERICYVVFCRFELFNLKDRYVYVREILFFVSKRKRERGGFIILYYTFSNGFFLSFFLSKKLILSWLMNFF